MGAAKNQPGLLSKSFEKSGAAGNNDPRPASQLSDRSSKGFDVSQYRMHLLKLKGAPYFTIGVNYRCSSVIDDSAASIAGGGGLNLLVHVIAVCSKNSTGSVVVKKCNVAEKKVFI